MKKVLLFSGKGIEYGDELYQTGTISNLNGGIITLISGGINGVGVADSGSVLRPRFRWGSSQLTTGKEYRLTLNPTINSGSTEWALYLENHYEFEEESPTNKDITFTYGGGNVDFAFNGRDFTFDVDVAMSLKEII